MLLIFMLLGNINLDFLMRNLIIIDTIFEFKITSWNQERWDSESNCSQFEGRSILKPQNQIFRAETQSDLRSQLFEARGWFSTSMQTLVPEDVFPWIYSLPFNAHWFCFYIEIGNFLWLLHSLRKRLQVIWECK